MLSEITVTKKINTVWFHSHEISRIVKLLEIESRMVVSRNWREKEIGVGLFLLVLQDEKVMDTGYTTVQIYLILLNCTLWQIDGETPETVTDFIFLGSKITADGDSVQLSSVTQLCLTLCNPMNCSTPGLAVHHQLSESTQTHVHRVGDAIQPSHPLLSPSPPALNLSQHQGLFKRVSSSHQVAKVLEFQLQHQSFQWTLRTDLH